MAQLSAEFALLKDEKAELEKRVLAVLRIGTWWGVKATAAEKQQALSRPGAVATLSNIIRDDWPAGAIFSDSDAVTDRVVALAPDLDPPVLAWGPCGQRYASLSGTATYLLRSLRRAAADALVVMIQDVKFLDAVTAKLVEAGFFDDDLFPSMLCAVMNRFWPTQDPFTAAAAPDQAQGLALSLMRIACMGAQADETVRRMLLTECALGVFMAYQDPWQIKWEPQTTQARQEMCREAGKAQTRHLPRELTGGKKWKDLRPPSMSKQEALREAQDMHYDIAGMPQLMAGFAGVVIRPQVIHRDDMDLILALTDHAHAECKIDRLLKCVNLLPPVYAGLSKVQLLLSSLWARRAENLSKAAMAEEAAGPVAKAAALRQSGNAAFKAEHWQDALADYQAALHQTPSDSALYSNVALVQLKLGAVNEAANAALVGLGHDATNVKAWVRLGDAYSEVGRWQLAQLCYKAALKLQEDPVVQERFAAAIGNLTVVWAWKDIPVPWDPAKVGRWLGSRAITQQDTYTRMMEKVTNSSPHAHTSRYIAVQLNQLYLTADATLQVNKGAMQAMPALHEWQCGYSDTPWIGKCSGAVKQMLSIADATICTNSSPILSPLVITEGKPSAKDLLQALAMTCLQGAATNKQLYKPKTLQLPYRMLYMYAEVKEVLTQWGVESVTIETEAEAKRSAKQCNTDWRGLNYANMYRTEKIFDLKGCKQKDKNNDQRVSSSSNTGGSRVQAGSSAAAAAAAAVGSSGSDAYDSAAAAAGMQQGFGHLEDEEDPQQAAHRETELQDYQRHGASNVDSGRPRRQVAGPETQAMLMDTWDGFSVIQNPSQSLPQGGGPTPEVKTVHLKSEGHCYQGRVGGTGDWLPGAQEWIRVLERTRGGLSNGTDRAWVQQEVRQRRQVFERQRVQLRQQQQQAQKKPGKKGK